VAIIRQMFEPFSNAIDCNELFPLCWQLTQKFADDRSTGWEAARAVVADVNRDAYELHWVTYRFSGSESRVELIEGDHQTAAVREFTSMRMN